MEDRQIASRRPLLALAGVACMRGDRQLFEGLDLMLSPGEAVVVTGPNGAGKTSLLRIAAGLLPPSAGRVTGVASAWLGEANALDGERRLHDVLRFWASLDGGAARLGAAMAAMRVDHLADVPVRLLSTGQRRRAALARIVAGGAALWLLDEPANGLDAEGVGLFGDAIAAHRSSGGAVLAATHLPLPMAARALVLG